jgi:hypothetical protein
MTEDAQPEDDLTTRARAVLTRLESDEREEFSRAMRKRCADTVFFDADYEFIFAGPGLVVNCQWHGDELDDHAVPTKSAVVTDLGRECGRLLQEKADMTEGAAP